MVKPCIFLIAKWKPLIDHDFELHHTLEQLSADWKDLAYVLIKEEDVQGNLMTIILSLYRS